MKTLNNVEWRHVQRHSILLLVVLGSLVGVSMVVNAIPALDDLYLTDRFQGFVKQYGVLKTIGIAISGMELNHEYRTYGLSRLLQFSIWLIGGGSSILYPLVMVAAQLMSAILLMALLRERGLPEDTSLATAIMWLLSPFAVNWSFHHFTYLIMPFQIVIATCFLLGRAARWRIGHVVAALLGVACALTGELQLLSAPVVLVVVAYASRDKARLRLTATTLTSMIVALALHRWYWSTFIKDATGTHRWDVPNHWISAEILARAQDWVSSLYTSVELQLKELLSFGFHWGIPIGLLVAIAFLQVTARRSTRETVTKSPVAGLPRDAGIAAVGLLLLLAAASSLIVPLAVAVSSGQIGMSMPRRYGFIPLTLVLMAATLATAMVSTAIGIHRRFALAVVIAMVAVLAGQLHASAVPEARSADKNLVQLMLDARDSRHERTLQDAQKGVAFFVASDATYLASSANGGTLGPKMDALPGLELLQSPFGYYWTSQHFSRNFLGFSFAAMVKEVAGDGSIRVAGSPYPGNPGNIAPQDLIVVANLGFEKLDPLGRNIRVFRDFNEFEPHFFTRAIERRAFELVNIVVDEFVVDLGLGSTGVPADGVALPLPDKKFGMPAGAIPQAWVEDYGLLSGTDGTYSHPNIGGNLAYYRTNRHGSFTYGVSFRDVANVEVILDFWEQWRRQPGERVFMLEVSWDGQRWADVGPIDLAALNGAKPLSIVLGKSRPRVFHFRLSPVAGTKDIPVVQGLRVRKLPQTP